MRRQYVTNDSTIEAFGELLSVNQNGMGMYNDELSAFFAMLDDPSRGRDRSFYISSWAGNERAVVNRIAAETAKAVASADIKGRFESIGIEPVGNTPGEAGKFLDNEIGKWAKVISTAGVKPEQ